MLPTPPLDGAAATSRTPRPLAIDAPEPSLQPVGRYSLALTPHGALAGRRAPLFLMHSYSFVFVAFVFVRAMTY